MSNYTAKHYKKEDEYSYCLGLTLTIELLKHKPEYATVVFIRESTSRDEGFLILESLAKKQKIEIIENNKAFNILDAKDNCFVIGVFKKFDCKLDYSKNHVCLVNPSDAGNLGTILRSSLGFNIENIVLIGQAVDEFSPKAVRSSMGAIFSLNIVRFASFDEYRRNDITRTLYPFMLKAKSELDKVDSKMKVGPYTLIFGNEATGLDDSYLKLGTPIIIKHTKRIDSINLPIAVSIALYEFTKDDELK